VSKLTSYWCMGKRLVSILTPCRYPSASSTTGGPYVDYVHSTKKVDITFAANSDFI